MAPTPESLARWLVKDINQAWRDHAMLGPGERLAVAVSGGKDSLALLRLLDLRRRWVPDGYELVALHVQGDARGAATPPHPPLADWLRHQQIQFRILAPDLPGNEPQPLGCQRCAWNRRRVLFQAAVDADCAAIAFAHHADDLAQTTLLNMIYHGRAETMLPRRDYFDGRLRLIRPLYRIPEKELRRFARVCEFPPPPPTCPQAQDSRRELARSLLRQMVDQHPLARVNLLRAGLGPQG